MNQNYQEVEQNDEREGSKRSGHWKWKILGSVVFALVLLMSVYCLVHNDNETNSNYQRAEALVSNKDPNEKCTGENTFVEIGHCVNSYISCINHTGYHQFCPKNLVYQDGLCVQSSDCRNTTTEEPARVEAMKINAKACVYKKEAMLACAVYAIHGVEHMLKPATSTFGHPEARMCSSSHSTAECVNSCGLKIPSNREDCFNLLFEGQLVTFGQKLNFCRSQTNCKFVSSESDVEDQCERIECLVPCLIHQLAVAGQNEISQHIKDKSCAVLNSMKKMSESNLKLLKSDLPSSKCAGLFEDKYWCR